MSETLLPAHDALAPRAYPARAGGAETGNVKISTRDVNVHYGDKHALIDVSLEIPNKAVTSLIGPSGCGKTTFLRCINRMNDLIDGCRVTGQILVDGEDIYKRSVDAPTLRGRMGMIFQKPNPFPRSVFENVAYGPRILKLAQTDADLNALVESALRRAALWDEVKDRLHGAGTALSGGQQQRLVIARALATDPDILLMDEPCSALDPAATAKIEELMDELRQHYCVVIVTHSMAQASRVSQYTAFFHLGQMVEAGATADIFSNPRDERTQDYITGRFG